MAAIQSYRATSDRAKDKAREPEADYAQERHNRV